MSASTQGTPSWYLKLEQVSQQLKPENYATWLLTLAKSHGIPDDVINAQLQRLGHEPLNFEDVPEEVLQAEFKEEPKRKAGRPPKQQKGNTWETLIKETTYACGTEHVLQR